MVFLLTLIYTYDMIYSFYKLLGQTPKEYGMKRKKNTQNPDAALAEPPVEAENLNPSNDNLSPAQSLEGAGETAIAAENALIAENLCAPDTQSENKDEATADKGVIVNGKSLTKSQQNKRTALRWILITLGSVLMSASVYFSQVPNNFTLGGIGGVSIILSKFITPLNEFTQKFMTQAVIMAIINVFLLVVGFIVLGKGCTLRTVYCSLLYTALIWVFEHFNLVSLVSGGKPTLTDQPFLELCYAILLFGVGGAVIFNCGASSGGTDIIALILKKFTRLNVGVALMIVDLIVVIVSIFTFDSATIVLFSFLGLFARTFLLDGVIESLGKTKCLTIITQNHEQIGEYILKSVNHSYTMYDAEGGYTRERKKVLVTVCKRSEALKIKLKVRQVDPQAFVIITDANEILGKGFGETF